MARCLLVTHYWRPHVGGIETVAAAHATELLARGWEVEVHTSRVPGGQPRHAVEAGVEVHRHAHWNALERSVRVPVPFPSPRLVAVLGERVREVDVVIAHGHVYPICVAATLAARRTRRPVVVVQHSPWIDYPPPIAVAEGIADRTVGRYVLQSASRVLCVSRHTRDFVTSVAPRAITEVLSNGVDIHRFHPDFVDKPGDTTRPRFVVLRRLVPRNGIDTVIDAWRRAELDDRAELIIAGDGPDRRRLDRRAAGLDHVEFIGFVDDDDLPDLYRGALAVVVPTRSGEGFGLSAAEALACGTAVIVTSEGALPEVVRHDVDGLVVPVEDPGALGAAMRRLIDDPGLGDRLRSGTRTRDWSWRSIGDRLDRVLRDHIGDGGP